MPLDLAVAVDANTEYHAFSSLIYHSFITCEYSSYCSYCSKCLSILKRVDPAQFYLLRLLYAIIDHNLLLLLLLLIDIVPVSDVLLILT